MGTEDIIIGSVSTVSLSGWNQNILIVEGLGAHWEYTLDQMPVHQPPTDSFLGGEWKPHNQDKPYTGTGTSETGAQDRTLTL